MSNQVYVLTKGKFVEPEGYEDSYVVGIYSDVESALAQGEGLYFNDWIEVTKNDYKEHYVFRKDDDYFEVERFWVED